MYEGQRFRFTKKERIKNLKRTETLFALGKTFMSYPFKVVYLETAYQLSTPLSVIISIPKKRIRSAVARNRMKRLFREVYRLNKHLFGDVLTGENSHIDVAFIYVIDELTDYKTVEKGVRKALMELKNKLVAERGKC